MVLGGQICSLPCACEICRGKEILLARLKEVPDLSELGDRLSEFLMSPSNGAGGRCAGGLDVWVRIILLRGVWAGLWCDAWKLELGGCHACC